LGRSARKGTPVIRLEVALEAQYKQFVFGALQVIFSTETYK